MAALEDLVARIRLDTSELEKGSSRAAAMGGAIGGAIGGLVAAGVGQALSSIKDFVSGSVDAYSELEDSTAAAGVVFGDSMGTIIDQSQTAAATLGLSSQQVINAANTFGTFGKAAGLTGSDLAGFSTNLTSLAGDMASFKGTSTEQAIEAVGAALRGETEPIRAYGVLLDDAALKAEAMEMGLYSGTGALSNQAKVLAAQSAILKQTSDAQGDFARTADSTANVQKRLAAEAENTQAKFGTLLAPAFTAVRNAAIAMLVPINSTLDAAIPKFQAFYDRASSAIGGLKALFASGDITSGLTSGLGVEEDSPLIGFLLGVRDTATAVWGQVSSVFSSIDLGAIIAPIGQAFSALGPTIAAVGPSILQIVTSFSPLSLLLKGLAPILPTIATLFSTLATTAIGALQPLIPIIVQVAGILSQALMGAISSVLPVVVQLATMLAGMLGQAVTMLAPLLVMIADAILQILPPILALLGPLLQLVATALMPLMNVVGVLISALLPPLIAVFEAILPPVVQLVTVLASALAPVLTLAGQLIGALAPVLTTVIGWIANAIGVVLKFAGPVLGGLISVLSSVIGWFGNIVGSISGFLGSIGQGIAAVGRFASSVGTAIGDAVGWFLGLPGRILGAIGNVGGLLLQVGKDLLSGLIEGAKAMASKVADAVLAPIKSAVNGVKNFLGISSPSKLFKQYGVWTGEGMVQGLEQSTGDVAQAAMNMANAVDQPVPPMNAPPGAYNGSPGAYGKAGVQVRVYIGDRELTDIVRVETMDVLDGEASSLSTGVTSA